MPNYIPQQGILIFNDGACLRIEKNGKTLLVTKDQVKTIDTVHENNIRIDIGEGPLKNIFLNYQDVSMPVVSSADALRDEIKAMLVTGIYDGREAKEITQASILSELLSIATILTKIQQREDDFTKSEPSRLDESNANMIYRGWHGAAGVPSEAEWAIERVRREDDIVISEWAFGSKAQTYSWDARDQHTYAPFNAVPALPTPAAPVG